MGPFLVTATLRLGYVTVTYLKSLISEDFTPPFSWIIWKRRWILSSPTSFAMVSRYLFNFLFFRVYDSCHSFEVMVAERCQQQKQNSLVWYGHRVTDMILRFSVSEISQNIQNEFQGYCYLFYIYMHIVSGLITLH